VRSGETKSLIYTQSEISGPNGSRWTVWALKWATIIRGGPYKMPASVNVLTETFALEQPPRLIDINRGGHSKLPALVNRFCEAVFLTALVNKKMTASEAYFKRSCKIIFLVVMFCNSRVKSKCDGVK